MNFAILTQSDMAIMLPPFFLMGILPVIQLQLRIERLPPPEIEKNHVFGKATEVLGKPEADRVAQTGIDRIDLARAFLLLLHLEEKTPEGKQQIDHLQVA